MNYKKMSEVDRFWSKVDKSGGPDSCWVWTACISKKDKYGKFTVRYGKTTKSYRSHRYSYKLTYGEISDSLIVCHKCDNTKCVNPVHLFIGTHKNNAEDRDSKGRNNPNYGEKQWNHKLTNEQVLEIRNCKGVNQRTLSELYGVGQWQISKIMNRKRWPHI